MSYEKFARWIVTEADRAGRLDGFSDERVEQLEREIADDLRERVAERLPERSA